MIYELEAPEVVFLCLTVPPPPSALGEADVGDRTPPPTLVALAAGPGIILAFDLTVISEKFSVKLF